jgi:hypothetical protein
MNLILGYLNDLKPLHLKEELNVDNVNNLIGAKMPATLYSWLVENIV